jgi:hypothetical protein
LTSLELAQIAQLKIEDSIVSSTPTTDETNFILGHINDFIHDIAHEMPPITTSADITATADTWTSLPTDFIRLYRYNDDTEINRVYITLDDVEYTGAYYLRVYGSTPQIMFPASGTYNVVYEQSPARLTSLSSEVTVHPYLAPLGADYLAWKKIESVNATAEQVEYYMEEQRLEQAYLQRKRQRLDRLLKPSNAPAQVMPLWG